MGSPPATRTVRTGGGGVHLYYRHAGGLLRNTAGRLPGVANDLPAGDCPEHLRSRRGRRPRRAQGPAPRRSLRRPPPPMGSRNNPLNRAALCLGMLVAGANSTAP
jgi:hypothetical protein